MTQNIVTVGVEGISISEHRKYVFERDMQWDIKKTVKCSVAYTMTEKREAWKVLPRSQHFAGSFLKSVPDFSSAPHVELKEFTAKDIKSFEDRVFVSLRHA